MKGSLILYKSQTEANKAKYLLDKKRIYSALEKEIRPRGGCVFGIRVYGNPREISDMLRSEHGLVPMDIL